MKLKIEMVPQSIWGRNLRSNDGLGKHRWMKLRQSILDQRGPSCAICGNEKEPHGHEVWTYKEKSRVSIARLVRVEIICRECHSIHHWGSSTRLVLQGAMPIDELKRLVRHACKLNNWKVREFKRQADKAMVIWKRRSDLRWKIDWGPFRGVVSDAKAARVEREIRLEKAAKAAHKAKPVQAVSAPFPGIDFDGDGPMERKRSGDRAGQKRRYRERQKERRSTD